MSANPFPTKSFIGLAVIVGAFMAPAWIEHTGGNCDALAQRSADLVAYASHAQRNWQIVERIRTTTDQLDGGTCAAEYWLSIVSPPNLDLTTEARR